MALRCESDTCREDRKGQQSRENWVLVLTGGSAGAIHLYQVPHWWNEGARQRRHLGLAALMVTPAARASGPPTLSGGSRMPLLLGLQAHTWYFLGCFYSEENLWGTLWETVFPGKPKPWLVANTDTPTRAHFELLMAQQPPWKIPKPYQLACRRKGPLAPRASPCNPGSHPGGGSRPVIVSIVGSITDVQLSNGFNSVVMVLKFSVIEALDLCFGSEVWWTMEHVSWLAWFCVFPCCLPGIRCHLPSRLTPQIPPGLPSMPSRQWQQGTDPVWVAPCSPLIQALSMSWLRGCSPLAVALGWGMVPPCGG